MSLRFSSPTALTSSLTVIRPPIYSMYYGSPFGDSLILPALWQGLWQATAALGIMIGAMSNGLLQDLIGRRYMFAVGGIVSAVGTAAAYVSADRDEVDARRGVLLAGKFVIGVSQGIMMSTCQTYVSEISPPRLRTVLLGFYPFFIVSLFYSHLVSPPLPFSKNSRVGAPVLSNPSAAHMLTTTPPSQTVGQMLAISIVFSGVMDFTPYAFKLPFACQWAFAGWAVLVGLVIPESPVHLVAKGKLAAAEKAIIKIYGPSTPAAERIQLIEATFEHEQSSSSSSSSGSPDDGAAASSPTYAECFRGSNLRRTRIVALLHTLQQFIGVSLLSNSTYFFIMAGMSSTMSLTINQVGIGLSMVFTLTSWFIMGKVGRRAAILASFVVAGVVFLSMGIAGLFPAANKAAVTYIGAALVITSLASNAGVGTAYPIVAAEIPSVRLRAKTTGLGFFVNALMTWLFSFTVPYMFNADAGNLGGKIGFVFAGFCAIGFVLTWIEIPETKDVPYAQIDYLFQVNTPTRAFKKTIVERD